MVVTHEVYIEYDQVSDLNEEIKPHWNICDKESVKEEYNKPLPVDETFLPIEENNGEIQNNKILLSDNDTDYIKYEQVSDLNEESKPCENTWGVIDILDPREIFDGKETVTKDYHKPHPVDENILP